MSSCNSWPTAHLGELCDIKIGRTPSRHNQRYWAGDQPWLSIADMNQGREITITKEKITSLAVDECGCTLVSVGTVLLSFKLSIGKVGIAALPMFTNEAIAALPIRNANRLDPIFLYWALKSIDLLAGTDRAVMGATLNKAKLQNIAIPLPPLLEQRRIAAILDQAEALRAKRRAALAKLDTLAQSIFIEMFGDPRNNPKAWPTRKIEEVAECLDRFRRPVTESDRVPGDVPYYGANGQQGWMDRALFNEPLVLVAEDGGHFEEPERGVAYRIDGPAWVNNHAHILRAISTIVETEFLHRALRHYNFVPYISGTTRAKLTQGQLNGAKIVTPPLQLQQEFSRRIQAMEELKGAVRSGLERLDALFASLQHRAFRGEL